MRAASSSLALPGCRAKPGNCVIGPAAFHACASPCRRLQGPLALAHSWRAPPPTARLPSGVGRFTRIVVTSGSAVDPRAAPCPQGGGSRRRHPHLNRAGDCQMSDGSCFLDRRSAVTTNSMSRDGRFHDPIASPRAGRTPDDLLRRHSADLLHQPGPGWYMPWAPRKLSQRTTSPQNASSC